MELNPGELQKLGQNVGLEVREIEQCLFDVALSAARSLPVTHSYHWLGNLGTVFREAEEALGTIGSELLARYILVAFTDDREWHPRCKVPDSVIEELNQERQRIYREATSCPAGYYYPFSDAFYKDFSILRGKSMPVYTGIVDTHGALWRRPLKFGSLSQRLRFARHLLLKPIGHRYFFQHHTHTSLLARFNREGWLRTYGLVADLLRVNPEHKGFCGSSWFYDPQLERVSPRLAYLANDPLANGAERFHLGEDESGSALAKSKTRNELHEQGAYVPQSYMLVWHRKPMIRWRGSFE